MSEDDTCAAQAASDISDAWREGGQEAYQRGFREPVNDALWAGIGAGISNAPKTVREILKSRKGSIKDAPLPKGSPSWDEIMEMTWDDIVRKAEKNEPGYRTIKKLLGDKRFKK